MANLIKKTIVGKIPILVGVALTVILTVGFFVYKTRLANASVVTDSFTDTTKINTGVSSNYFTQDGKIRMMFNTGIDGAATVSTIKNINTGIIGNRTVADGINYTVTALGTNTITTSGAPNGIAANDEVLLINLQGASTAYQNVGKYEFLRVQSVAGSVITLKTDIVNIYGQTTSNATLTGQNIMVQRVPNYSSLTVTGTGGITANAFNGTIGGVVAFRVAETLTINSGGYISASVRGYRQNASGTTESFCGPSPGYCGGGRGSETGPYGAGAGAGSATGGAGGIGGWLYARDSPCDGGRGGYGTAGGGGGGSYCTSGGAGCTGGGVFGACSGSGGVNGGGGGGGGSYGTANLSRLFFGSPNGRTPNDAFNGVAGGIIYLFANTLSNSGSIQSSGSGGTGGSILLDAYTNNIGTGLVTAVSGRIAASGTVTGTSTPNYNANSYTLPTATIQSINLISGKTATSFSTFVYNLSVKPTNSTATIQFSNDGTNWYNSTGTLGASNTLTTGTNNSINLAPLNWSGGSFYYKVAFGGPATPALDDVTLNYIQHLEPPVIGTPSNVTTTSIRWNFTDYAPDETGFKLYDENDVLKVTCAGVNLTYCDETNLTPGTLYTRKVAASDANGIGEYSSPATIATLSLVPQKPVVDQGTSTTLRVDVVPGQGAPGTNTYAIYVSTGACDGSNANLYLNKASGNLGTIDWQRDDQWLTTQVNGLNLDSNIYKVCVKSKSESGVETVFGPYNENNGTYIPLNGYRVTDQNQFFTNKYKDGNNPTGPTARSVYGVDNGIGPTGVNTAIFEIAEGANIVVGEFDTLVFGSLKLTSGTLSLDEGGILKPGGKLLVNDVDSDNIPRKIASISNDIPLYYTDATGSLPAGFRRRSAIPTMALSKPDCNDDNANVWVTAANACYKDADVDSYTAGLEAGGAATCINTLTCATATKYSASTDGAAVTTKSVGALRDAPTAESDCDDTSASIYRLLNGYPDNDGDGHGAGTLTAYCSGASLPAGKYATSTDCYDGNANAKPGSTYCSGTNRGDGSYDYNCSGTQTTCGTQLYSRLFRCVSSSCFNCYCPCDASAYVISTAINTCGTVGYVPSGGVYSQSNMCGGWSLQAVGASSNRSCQ